MRIVVTGSSGHLGMAVVKDLLGAGHDVVCIDRREPADRLASMPPVHQIDLLDVHALLPLMRTADAVCHLGNQPYLPETVQTAGFLNNVGSTHAVIESALHAGVGRIVNASSVQAYGVLASPHRPKIPSSVPHYLPIDESHPLLPTDGYSLSKAIGEWTAESFCRQVPDLQIFSLRLSAILGEAPKPIPAEQAESHFTGALLSAVHITDAARACRLCCEQHRPGHRPINIVSARSLAPWKPQWIEKIYGTLPPFRRPLSGTDTLFTCDLAERLLGFRTEIF